MFTCFILSSCVPLRKATIVVILFWQSHLLSIPEGTVPEAVIVNDDVDGDVVQQSPAVSVSVSFSLKLVLVGLWSCIDYFEISLLSICIATSPVDVSSSKSAKKLLASKSRLVVRISAFLCGELFLSNCCLYLKFKCDFCFGYRVPNSMN